MEDLIAIDKLIIQAVQKGVNFGKGDPYNRLRYYTKIGLLPHMVRKRVNNEMIGHYPSYTLDLLLEIEKLKSLGFSNDEIGKKLKLLTTSGFSHNIHDHKTLKLVRILTPSAKTIKLVLLAIFIITVFAGSGIIPIGKSRNDLIKRTLELDKKYISDSGTGYLRANQKKVYIKSQQVKLDSKINVTFSSDYTPASRYWISQKLPLEGFYLELDTPSANDVEFSWWVSN